MRRDFPYTRIPGTQRGIVRKSSLWAGTDHFLLVRGTRFSEEYRRFNYRDVEALVVQRCARAGSIGWWLLTVLVFALAALMFSGSRFPKVITGPIVLVLGLLIVTRLVISLRHGCRCFVQTAVSREELPSLHRTWIAGKALKQLRGKIAEAQGPVSEDVSSLLAVAEADAPRERCHEAPLRKPHTPQAAIRTVSLAVGAFLLLLVDAAQTFSSLDGPSPTASVWARILAPALVIGMGGLTFFSLLGTNGVRSMRALRKWLFVALFFQWCDIYLGILLGRTYSVQQGTVTITITALRTWHWAVGIDGTLCVLLGCGGLVFVLLNWQSLRRGDVSAA